MSSYVNAYRKGEKVIVWERDGGVRKIVEYDAPYYFYYEDERGEYTSLYGKKLARVDFDTNADFYHAKSKLQGQGIKLYESDVNQVQKVLSQNYYRVPVPDLHVTYLDIEVDYDKTIGFSSVENPYAIINSVALFHSWSKEKIVFAVPPDGWNGHLSDELQNNATVVLCENEHELLVRLLLEIQESDGIVGWNSSLFDVPYICKRIERVLGPKHFAKMSFEGAPKPKYDTITIFNREQTKVILGGRLDIDYLDLFKKFEMSARPSYKLEAISNEVLPDMAKLDYEGSLSDLYRNDFDFFLRYNVRDVECLYGFEEKLGYVALANELYHEATGQFANILGTIKLAELSIINYCHYEMDNIIVPDAPELEEGFDETSKAQGAYVLTPKKGLQENVGSVDIASLYPSAIRSINISPETLVGQFDRRVDAFECLLNDTDDILVATLENHLTEKITEVRKTVKEWKEDFKTNKWAVSGYGTIFTQEKQGVIPSILENWFAIRKKYKKLKAMAGTEEEKAYNDRIQYCYKIKLNSLYGALLNQHFKFHDARLGESTTGTGRGILRHMCSQVNELLTGEYDSYGKAVVYGDTDSVYFKTFANGVDEAVLIADTIEKEVNKSFPSFMQKAFHCTKNYDQLISAEREIVASRGIFVTPKRYILRVVDKEGEKCDELKIMGLDTKKTILPMAVRNELNGFLGRYLRGEDWSVIEREIIEYKSKLRNDEDFTILGLPKGVNKVEYYLIELEKDENARVPGHVRASILYNEKCREYEDKVSMPIVSSMKIRVFYLKNPVGKFKSIALPVDIEVVPQWFRDNIEIDKEKQIERLVDNPLKNVLKAIDKEPPTEQMLYLNDELEF